MGQAASASNERSDDSADSPRRRRRWPWILLAVGVAGIVGVRALLPTLVERGVAWGSRQYLGLPARLDNVDFELLRGHVVLEGFALGARPDAVAPNDAALAPPAIDPASALVQVQRISTRISWRALRERTLQLSELSVTAPTLRAVREADGKIDPLRHAQPVAQPSAEPEPAPAAEPSPPWKIALERFELRTPNLRVLDATSGQDLAELSLELLTLDQLAVRGSELEVGGVGLEGPVLRLRRDLLLREAKPPGAAQKEPAAPAAPAAGGGAPAAKSGYRVAKLDVQRASFTWITESGPLDVALTLKASDITAEQGKRFPIDLALEVGDGRIGVVGEVGILPPTYTGKFRWSGLPIPRILLASLPQLATWLREANSSGDLEIDADPMGKQGEPSMRVKGRLSFDALAVADPKGTEVTLGWKQLEVVASDVYAPLPQQGKPLGTTKAVLESVRLEGPSIRYTRPSPQLDALLGINLSGSAPSGGKPPAPAPAAQPEAAPAQPPTAQGAPAQAPLALEIASLELSNGDVEAIDKTVTPTARTHVRNLSLEAKQVRFPDPAAESVRFRALLPIAAQLDVQGKLAPGNVGDFTLKLAKLDLPVFNPYAGLAGVTVDRGRASVDAKIKLRGAKLEIDNRLVLNQLGVSMRNPETFERQFGMPLDLTLALLRDPKGDIALHIPVKLDEKGTTLGIGAIVASALKAALIGAVTAPFKMLGAVFGGSQEAGGGLALEPLPSVAGASDLEGDQGPRLGGLAQMLAQRPALALALRGRTGPEDHPKLAEQILVERWQRGEGLPPLEDTSFLARRRIGQALSARAKGKQPTLAAEDEALYQRYVAAVQVPEERLAALAKARAEHVRDALVAKGAVAARVAVGANESESKPGVVIGFAAGG